MNALSTLQNQRWPPNHGELLFITSIPFDYVLEIIELDSKVIGSTTHRGFERGHKRSFDEIEK